MNHIGLLSCLFTVSAINYVSSLEAQGIIGGDEASKDQFPYQIFIQTYDKLACGGAILSENFILTAAHCVINGTSGDFKSLTFTVVGKTLSTKVKPVEVTVSTMYVLKDYNPKVVNDDIALFKLSKPLELSKNKLRAVKLPSASETYTDVKAVISGYGWDKINVYYDNETGQIIEDGSTDGKLKFAAVNVLSNIECERTNYPQKISSTQICGKVIQRGRKNKYEGICSGDSGGPLVYKDFVIGVASLSPDECNETTKAAVYTRVSSYLAFINGVMNGNIDSNVRERKIT